MGAAEEWRPSIDEAGLTNEATNEKWLQLFEQFEAMLVQKPWELPDITADDVRMTMRDIRAVTGEFDSCEGQSFHAGTSSSAPQCRRKA